MLSVSIGEYTFPENVATFRTNLLQGKIALASDPSLRKITEHMGGNYIVGLTKLRPVAGHGHMVVAGWCTDVITSTRGRRFFSWNGGY